MRCCHGERRFAELLAMIQADRDQRYATNEGGTMPMSSTAPNTEMSAWPYPHVCTIFNDIKAREVLTIMAGGILRLIEMPAVFGGQFGQHATRRRQADLFPLWTADQPRRSRLSQGKWAYCLGGRLNHDAHAPGLTLSLSS